MSFKGQKDKLCPLKDKRTKNDELTVLHICVLYFLKIKYLNRQKFTKPFQFNEFPTIQRYLLLIVNLSQSSSLSAPRLKIKITYQ